MPFGVIPELPFHKASKLTLLHLLRYLTPIFFDRMIFQLAYVWGGKHTLDPIKIISGRKIIIRDKRFALNLWANPLWHFKILIN